MKQNMKLTYVTKWQVVAEDRDQAFDIWLEQSVKIDLKTEDGTRLQYVLMLKTMDRWADTKEIAEIKYNKEDNEVYAE